MNALTVGSNFSALSLKDLLEARDLYHFHLMHKQNVIATAVGRYLIRKTDPWPTEGDKEKVEDKRGDTQTTHKGKRTLENSEIRRYSWPCILVFVDHWVEASAWMEGGGPNIPQSQLRAIREDTLASIYRPNSFVISKPLGEMGPLLAPTQPPPGV